jgi:hypothetical protein
MRIERARVAVGRVFFERCFWLFAVIVTLIAVMPFVEPTSYGRLVLGALNAFVVVASVAAVGRSAMAFVIALLFAVPAVLLQAMSIFYDDRPLIWQAWALNAGVYVLTIGYLLRYVFQPEVMTADKLWGAAAAYLLIGVLWTYLYAIVGYFYVPSFAEGGKPEGIDLYDLLYFSFTSLTSTGFGDIVPLSRQARSLSVLEQITGALYLAVLIARLAGVYPPQGRESA